MLTFLGDVALIGDGETSAYKPNDDYIFNCEYVICDKKLYKPAEGKINLSALNCSYEEIFGKNPIAVSLTNNHIFDFGEKAYEDTKATLYSKGIDCIETEPWHLGNVFVLSFMDLESGNPLDGTIQFNEARITDNIKSIKKNVAAKIVALVHWGIENDPNAAQEQRTLAHWLIDSGVDLVIGHHPHCIQPIEKYKGKYIFYSLGNGLFPPINQPSHYDEHGKPNRIYRFKWRPWNRESLAVTIDDRANVICVELLYQTRNTLKKKKNLSINELLIKKDKPRFIYYLRKYWLFFVSNVFVDGKIFDLNAVKSELMKR